MKHGEKALRALRQSELLANLPVLFLGAKIGWDWSPTRDPIENPMIYDPYNQIVGGLALGIQFDLDPAKSLARAEQATAQTEEVLALKAFAKTGIPLRVLQAHQALTESKETLQLAQRSVKVTRKWMVFAGGGYMTGTGEAQDLLEGVGAFLQAKRSFYQALLDYYLNQGKLNFATGTLINN